jgi:hypothetical protein
MKEKPKKVVAFRSPVESVNEALDGFNANVVIRHFGCDYQGLTAACGKKRKIYAYIHGGAVFSESPFSCPWDSGCIGFMWTNSDKTAAAVVAALNEWVTNDHWYSPELGECGSYDCLKKIADERGLEIDFID